MLAAQLPTDLLIDHFDLVTPLRLARVATDAQRAHEFRTVIWPLESHCARRRDTGIWLAHARHVVQPMLQHCGHLLAAAAFADDDGDEAFVQRLCGIMDVNAMELRTACADRIAVRGLYPWAALLPHSCANNTFVTVDGEQTMRVYASVAIGSGETVYNNYTGSLMVSAMNDALLCFIFRKVVAFENY